MRTKNEIRAEIDKANDGIKLERRIARFADRHDPRSARVIKIYHETIAELKEELQR